MNKYKKNITIKIACIFTEFMICVIPMVLIIFLFLSPERLTEFFWIILIMLVLIIVFNLFLYLISLIGKIFIKTTYIINEDKIIVNGKNYKKTIDLSQVEAITYDLGELSKYGRNPSKLVIFDKDYKELLTIKNPPLMMVVHVRKKCQGAKISYYNSKRILFFLVLCSGIAIAISLIAIISK